MALNKSFNVVIKAKDETKEALKSISSNVASLKQSFASAQNGVNSLKNSFVGIATAVGVFKLAGEAVQGFKSQMDELSVIKDIADNFNIAVESANNLTAVYKVNGLGAQELQKHLEKLSIGIGEALADENKLKKFKELGITLEDLKNKDVAQVFEKIQENVSELDKSVALSSLKDIFGKGGFDVLDTALDESAKRIRERNKISEETTKLAVQANDDLNRSYNELMTISDIYFNKFIADYAPAVNVLIKTLIETYDEASKFGDKQEEIGQTEAWANLAIEMADFANVATIGIVSIIRTFGVLIDTVQLVGDSVNALLSPFVLLSKSILSVFTNTIYAIRNAWEAVKNLDFAGALNAFKNAATNIVTNFNNIPTGIGKSFSKIGKEYSELKENFTKPIDVPFDLAKVRANAKKYGEELLKATKEIKGVDINRPNKPSGGDTGKTDKKTDGVDYDFQNALGYLNNYINEEKRIFAERQKYLELDRQYNLIADEDYYAQKQKLLEENTAKQIEALNAELSLIDAKNAKTTNEKEKIALAKQEYDIKQKIVELESDLNYESKKNELELQKQKVVSVNEEIQAITKKYDIQEKYINLSNSLNEGEKISAIKDLREKENQELENKIELLKKLAVLTRDPKEKQAILDQIDTIKIGIEETKNASEQFAKDFNNQIGQEFKGFFTDVIKGTESIGDSFDNLIGNISDMLLDLALNDIFKGTNNFSSVLGGVFGGGVSSGGGGGFDFGGMISGIGSLLGFADGGVTPVNKPFLVGEKGPELMFLNKSSYVANNADTQKMLGGGGGNVTVHMTVNAKDAASFKNSESQITAQYSQALRKANRNL